MQRFPLLLMCLALAVALGGFVVQLTASEDVNLGPAWILAASLGLGAALLFERPDDEPRWDDRRRTGRR